MGDLPYLDSVANGLFIDFFVGFHIVCDRYTLDKAHYTYFNTIVPLSLSSGFGSEVYP